MNSRVTMGLAAVLLLGAVFVGYWGLVLSRQPAPVAEAPAAPNVTVEKTVAIAEDQTRQPVVVLLHDVPPFSPLTATDRRRRHRRKTAQRPGRQLKQRRSSGRPHTVAAPQRRHLAE